MVEELLLLRGRPAYYRIYLQGILNPGWARDFVDLKLERVHSSATADVTILKGEVVDQGTHDELLERCSLYRRIFARYTSDRSIMNAAHPTAAGS